MINEEKVKDKIRKLIKYQDQLNKMQDTTQEISMSIMKDSFDEMDMDERCSMQRVAMVFSEITHALAGSTILLTKALLIMGLPQDSLELKRSEASIRSPQEEPSSTEKTDA